MGNLLPSLGRRSLPLLEMPKAGGKGGRELVAVLSTRDTGFTAPVAGVYTFYAFGAGGRGGGGNAYPNNNSYSPGSSGSAFRKTVRLNGGDLVTATVGYGGQGGSGGAPTNTVLTFPDGSTATAGPGSNGVVTAGSSAGPAGGTATGGDVNVPGIQAVNSSTSVRDGTPAPVLDGLGGWLGAPGANGGGSQAAVAYPGGFGTGGATATFSNSNGGTIQFSVGGNAIVFVFREP